MVATDFEREARLAINHWQEELSQLEAKRADVEARIALLGKGQAREVSTQFRRQLIHAG